MEHYSSLCCCIHFWESKALKFCFIDCVSYYCLWHHLVLWIEKRPPHLAKQQLPLEVTFYCKMVCLPQGILNNLRLLLCYDTRTSIRDDNFHRTYLRVDAFSTNCSGFVFFLMELDMSKIKLATKFLFYKSFTRLVGVIPR